MELLWPDTKEVNSLDGFALEAFGSKYTEVRRETVVELLSSPDSAGVTSHRQSLTEHLSDPPLET